MYYENQYKNNTLNLYLMLTGVQLFSSELLDSLESNKIISCMASLGNVTETRNIKRNTQKTIMTWKDYNDADYLHN